MKWCLSNQFDIKDIIYQAHKTKLSDIKNFLTGTNNSGKPDLENANKFTTATTTTTPPTAGSSTISNGRNSSIRIKFKQRSCTSEPRM